MRAYLVPHVPFMIPELGGNQFKAQISEILDTFKNIQQDLISNPPDAILICSPHYQNQVFQIGMAAEYRGSFANFRRPDLVDIRKGNLKLSKHIQKLADDIGFIAPSEPEKVSKIDYGTIVPLKLIDPTAEIPIVPISVSMGSKREHFLWGKKLYDFAASFSDNIVFIASTELTQDFKEDVRAYPDNNDEDISYLHIVKNGEIDKIEQFNENYFDKVENQLLPTCILSGFGSVMDESEILLYTGFVGCGCAFLEFR